MKKNIFTILLFTIFLNVCHIFICLADPGGTEDPGCIGEGADNNVSIDDEQISARHADLTITQDGQYVLTELSSTNGTFVNGQRIIQCQVNQGDHVDMGDTTIII